MSITSIASHEKNLKALSDFRRSARKMNPTRRHRPAIWECMLGTVYARNAAGKVEYFDYDYVAAVAHVGPYVDARVSRVTRGYYDLQGTEIPAGKLVWFVIDNPTEVL